MKREERLSKIEPFRALHMATCQVIYNVFGALLFYPIKTLRNIPLHLAERIGETTARVKTQNTELLEGFTF